MIKNNPLYILHQHELKFRLSIYNQLVLSSSCDARKLKKHALTQESFDELVKMSSTTAFTFSICSDAVCDLYTTDHTTYCMFLEFVSELCTTEISLEMGAISDLHIACMNEVIDHLQSVKNDAIRIDPHRDGHLASSTIEAIKRYILRTETTTIYDASVFRFRYSGSTPWYSEIKDTANIPLEERPIPFKSKTKSAAKRGKEEEGGGKA